MTVEHRYMCNLCRAGKPPEKLTGLHFVHKGIELRESRQVESHLCQSCLLAIHRIAKELLEAGRITQSV